MDKNYNKRPLKSVATFRSGKFTFSTRFDLSTVLPPLIESRTLSDIINSIPLSNKLKRRFNQSELTSRAIFNTASINGNPLSRDRIETLINMRKTAKPRTRIREIEILNLKEAFEFAFSDVPAELTEDTIKEIHRILTKGLDDKLHYPGRYNTPPPSPAYLKHSTVFSAPRILSDIKLLMNEFAAWISQPETKELGPEIRAALAHYHLVLIQPFATSNCKTAMIVESMLLKNAGIKYVPELISSYYINNYDAYRSKIEEPEVRMDHDLSGLLEFVLKGHEKTLSKVLETITRSFAVLVLEDNYESLREEKRITEGQLELLKVMLANPGTVTLKKLIREEPYRMLYRYQSERTARRDLKRLTELKLITASKDKNFELNLVARD
ncbi:MAG: Fic family protein [Thermodesulfobacteriota bacterium]